MSSISTVCAVLLIDEAYRLLGDAIAPYVKEGRSGKYMYCMTAAQNGSFLDMTFHPSQCDGSVADIMIVSVPLQFVKFMATGASGNALGFTFTDESIADDDAGLTP